MREIITVDETNGLPTINPEIRAVKAYRDLIARDKDRFKKRSTKELALIALLCSPGSYLHNYSDEMRMQKGIDDLDLGKNWKPDKYFNKAYELYSEDIQTPTIRVLNEAREALHIATNAIKFIRKNVAAQTDNIEHQLKEDDRIDVAMLQDVIKQIMSLFDLSKELPKMIEKIKDLEKQAAEEMAGSNVVYGEGTLSKYEK